MFSEILRIKPVLDPATTKRMEVSLSQRFSRVAKRFGKGLSGALKGTILGISVGLLSKLLNPIQDLEDRIKNLLGESTDIRDLADRFGAKPGEVRRLQDLGQALGVKPDELADMLNRFGQALETARKEIESGEDLSLGSQAVRNYTDRENIVEAFQDFMKGLRQLGQGPSRTVTTPSGVTKEETGLQRRQNVEREVFGERFTGASRRLVETDLQKEARRIGEPNVNQLNRAITKVAGLADQQRASEVRRNTEDFINASGNVNSTIIQAMEKRAAQEQAEATQRLKSYQDLAKTSEFLGEIMNMLKDVTDIVVKGLRMLSELVGDIKEVRKSGIWRGIFGGGK